MSAVRPGLRRLPTSEEIDAFWADGAVVLRGVLDPDFVLALEPDVTALLDEPEMADMTAMGDGLAAAGERVLRDGPSTRGRFRSGVDHWLTHPRFAAFACDSGLPAIVGRLLRATRVNLWEDSVLVKEPGAGERTAWHQDLSYFHVEGEQLCTTWVPLDHADAESGAMAFVRGSHRWSSVFRPNLFVSTMPIPGTDGDEVPDVDAMAATGEVEIVQWELGPGDVSVHHARTLHAAGANRTADRWRRAISVRYCGDDARYHFRAGAPRKPHHTDDREGSPVDHPACPLVWTA
jgi:ectoine hydroxylase-related dioxygenase (phytanoyl-CoA dioxygenase family)